MLSLRPHCRHKPHTNQSVPRAHTGTFLSGCITNTLTAREHPARLSPGFRTVESALQLFTSVALIAGRLSIPEVARC